MTRPSVALSVFVFILISLLSPAFAQEAATRGIRVQAVEDLTSNTAESGEPVFHFLGIGINDYDYWPDLKAPVQDVSAVRDVLLERYLFDESNVSILYNDEATRPNIEKALRRLNDVCNEQDSVIIYYAGHGYTDEVGGYWIPTDGHLKDSTTWMMNGRIKSFIKQNPARHVLLISDSCFAGDFFRGRSRGIADITDLPSTYRQKYTRVSRYALTSGNLEPVTDQGINENHSIFAHFFLRALKDNTQPYLVPSHRNLLGYIEDGLNQSTHTQRPVYGAIIDSGSANGELVLFLRPDLATTPMQDDAVSQGDIWTPELAPLPDDANALLFTHPMQGFLDIDGKRYDLSQQPTVYLTQGTHRFRLTQPGERPIYGRLTVHVVDDETRPVTFGMTEGILIKESHVRAALNGAPVRYRIRVGTSRQSKTAISYALSLNPI